MRVIRSLSPVEFEEAPRRVLSGLVVVELAVVAAWRAAGQCGGVRRLRPSSRRIGDWDRDGHRLRQRVGLVVRDEDPESDDALRADNRLQRPAALRTGDKVRSRGRSEPQAATGTANVGHSDPFLSIEARASLAVPPRTLQAAQEWPFVVAVAMADRLSAPLDGNVALKARRARAHRARRERSTSQLAPRRVSRTCSRGQPARRARRVQLPRIRVRADPSSDRTARLVSRSRVCLGPKRCPAFSQSLLRRTLRVSQRTYLVEERWQLEP